MTPLRYAGVLTETSGSMTNTGPLYNAPATFYPYAMLDTARRTFFYHPDVRNGAVAGVRVPVSGTYDLSAVFARANDALNAGDGVRVVVFVNNLIAAPLFDAVIASDNSVNTSSFFTGTGIAPFHTTLRLAQGDTIQFAVFSGPKLVDGSFDVTALQFTVTGGGASISLPRDFPQVINPTALSLDFKYVPGGASPASQSLGFSTTPAGLAVVSATATANGGNWLSAAISDGTLTASVNPAGLASGKYDGTITLTAPAMAAGANSVVVPVTLTVASLNVTITRVSNAASGATGIESGSGVSIYGTNLSASTRSWQLSDFLGNSLPAVLDGVSVTINGNKAAINFISPGQLNLQAPTDAATGPVQVRVTNAYGSATGTATLQPYAPGFFAGAKYVAAVHTDGVYVAPTGFYGSTAASRPAQPGEIILIYGTGFGPTTPVVPAGQLFSDPAPLTDPAQLHISIGGIPATVKFAGMVVPGEYQCNVVMPTVADGDQPIVATIAELSTQAGLVIAIKN